MESIAFKQTGVDLTGLLKVLGENLYSKPDVAIRELIQNASDAISRRSIENDQAFEPRIGVHVISAEKKLVIEDNGSGLTVDEIEHYLARIGSGYTRELRAQHADEGNFIGAFGLGFLTAYMIGQKVTVETTSYKSPEIGHRFVSEGGQSYVVSETSPREIGSKVTISLRDEFHNMSDPARLENVIATYCRLMYVPIYLHDGPTAVNIVPPWRAIQADWPQVKIDKETRNFAELMEPKFAVLATVTVQTDETLKVNGLLWVHDSSTYGGSDNRWLQIYIRGMMVVANKHDFLPRWASFISGVIEADNISPTASREDVQSNEYYQTLKSAVADSLIEGLASIAKTAPEKWRTIIRRHNEALLGAAIADYRLFEALKESLSIPTSEGDLTLPEIASRSDGQLIVTTSSEGGADEVVAKAFGRPVILGYRYGALGVASQYAEQMGLDIVELGTASGHQALFPTVSPPDDIADKLKSLLERPDFAVKFSEFEPGFLSLVSVVDREQQIKKAYESDQADQRFGAAVLQLARSFTKKIDSGASVHMIVNMKAPLVQKLVMVEGRKAEAVADAILSSANMLGSHKTLGEEGFSGAMKSLNAALLELLEGNHE